MSKKCEENDILILKNKKLIKDIETLEETFEDNKIKAERQKDEELRECKESLNQKYK